MARQNSKTAPKKERKKDKRYRLELSLPSIFLWCFCFLFLLGWIFVLGILVGRGYLPGGAKSIAELPRKISELPEVIGSDQTSEEDVLKDIGKDPEFAFYEKLSIKKREAARQQSHAAVRPQPPAKKVEPPPRARDDASRPYTLQLASLEKEEPAAGLVKRLNAHGRPAYLTRAEVKGKTYFRVRCGRFASEKEAAEYNKRLADQEGLRGFVLKAE